MDHLTKARKLKNGVEHEKDYGDGGRDTVRLV